MAKLRYQVETPGAHGSMGVAAKFAKRSNALAYADAFDNVSVRRVTDLTNRQVYSRSTKESNGFVTISESETLRAK